MGRTSRRLRARKLGRVAAKRPADRATALAARSTCTAHELAGRITLAFLVSLLVGCASAPEPLDLGPPPGGPTRPALQMAPLEIAIEASADRPTVKAGDPLRPNERVVCVTCGEESGPDPDAERLTTSIGSVTVRPRCPECDGETYREPFGPPFRPRLSGKAIDAELVGALRARGGFAAVDTGAEGTGWRLEARLESSAVRYARNGAFGLEVATFVVTAILIFPAVDIPNWFFASEDYTLELTGSWTLRDLAAGTVVAEGTARTRTTGSFAEFGPGPTREWHLVGFLRAPGCLEEDEWSEIADQLVPTAQLDFARELARQVEAVRVP